MTDQAFMDYVVRECFTRQISIMCNMDIKLSRIEYFLISANRKKKAMIRPKYDKARLYDNTIDVSER